MFNFWELRGNVGKCAGGLISAFYKSIKRFLSLRKGGTRVFEGGLRSLDRARDLFKIIAGVVQISGNSVGSRVCLR